MKNIEEQYKEQLMRRMVLDNPWWATNAILPDFDKLPRRKYTELFYKKVTEQSVRRALILMGPRRVGKTVMIYHTIDKLIRAGVDPKKIIYLSVDTPVYTNVSLESLFYSALEALRQEGNYEGYYVFFDEIQYLKNWELHLKSMVDTFLHSKFVVSGSAAAALKMKSIESGAGRFTDFTLPPLTFYEYMSLLKLDNIIVCRYEYVNCPFDTIDIQALNKHFLDYVNYGGFPEVVFSKGAKENPSQYVKNDIVDKVLLRDLPSLYGITDIQELNKLFVHIAFCSGNEFSYESLSSEAGIRKEVVKRYLSYFEAAFLIKVVYKIDQNAKRMQRVTTFKIYLTNPALRCALFSSVGEGDDALGAMVETAMFAQWMQANQSNLYYANWANGRQRGEVDMVWLEAASQRPYSVAEIKWTDRFAEDPSGLKSLASFVESNKYVRRIIVTSKTKTGTGTIGGLNVCFVPAALYAYWVSNYLFTNQEQKVLLPAELSMDSMRSMIMSDVRAQYGNSYYATDEWD